MRYAQIAKVYKSKPHTPLAHITVLPYNVIINAFVLLKSKGPYNYTL